MRDVKVGERTSCPQFGQKIENHALICGIEIRESLIKNEQIGIES